MVASKESLEKVKQIASHYGLKSQMSMAQEECAELIQAISKLSRAGEVFTDDPEQRLRSTNARYMVSEEMADVWNLLLQLEYLLGNEEIVAVYLQHKLGRTLRKIQEESHELRT